MCIQTNPCMCVVFCGLFKLRQECGVNFSFTMISTYSLFQQKKNHPKQSKIYSPLIKSHIVSRKEVSNLYIYIPFVIQPYLLH